MPELITVRELNRATLARQHLLDRTSMPVEDLVEHLVGLQAQTPHSWYVGLWDRLADFDPDEVGQLLTDRRLVRLTLMRGTIHLVTARDALRIRPHVDQMIFRLASGVAGRAIDGVDLDELARAGRNLLAREPMQWQDAGRRLTERFPGRDPASLAMGLRATVPLVQVPPRGVWGRGGQARHTPMEHWLADAAPPKPITIDELVLRYLRAFGPASVADVQTWCGLTRLREVVDRLAVSKAGLARLVDESGRELVDVPDGPRPDPDTPAPVRFLYDYDNVTLSYADRSRLRAPGADPIAGILDEPGPIPGTVLVDGTIRAGWVAKVEPDRARVDVWTRVPFRSTDGRAGAARIEAAIEAEGLALLDFLAPDRPDRVVAVSVADRPPWVFDRTR